ncbi:uncharacterized protein TNCV_4160951 [Trichonephila clavipes]|nr:uncharacterized protein TNCV_4160951 [Trichonephila clavipes]
MTEYTNAEKADMILAHGATDCNGRATQRLYAEKHPVRRTPAHTMFARLHQQLCGTGSFQKAAHTELNEEIVLDMVETTPSLSTRGIANEIGISYSSAFPQWYLQQRIANPFFEASVLFTDEASFSREGIFNTHNSHSWAAANPHVTRTRAAQDRFLVNVWADILGDHLIGPYILPGHLTGPRYLIFLEQVLPKLLDRAHVTAATRISMWFQQDGAPAHFSISVRNHLDAVCGERWIGRGGPVHLFLRSPDLSCLDYFFWGQVKSLVYETPVNNAEERVARISAAAGEIRNTPEMLSNVRRSMKRRCEACIMRRATVIRVKSHFTATPNSIALSLITTMCHIETPVAYVILILHHLDRTETASITVLTVAFLNQSGATSPIRFYHQAIASSLLIAATIK